VSKESRKNKRFDAKEGATAAIVTPDDQEQYESIGQIVDISMGGLSLQYDAKTDSYHGIMELDVEIFGYSSQRMRMYVGRLPCKVVYDRLVATDEQKSLDTRRLGLEFSDVPYYRLHKLGNFVELFALMQKEKEKKDKD
jgi:c-di-GMP-binding flagellar brake protein YcgR